jgi:adenosine deaminase CECR1
MMFSLAKDRMEGTQLWKIIRRMPKGALLHAHMDAMVDFDYLFDVLLSTKGMHIYCEKGLHTDEAREGAPIKFRFQKVDRGIYFIVIEGVSG